MSEKIKIVADSTCDLSPELVEKYDIDIIPMPIHLGDEVHYDMQDIVPEDLYNYFAKTKQLAKTSAINSSVFEERWKKWLDEGYTVINFDISSEMSSVYNCARVQALEHEGRVFAVDSKNLSTGIGLSVIKAAELAAEGKSAKEIFDYLEGYVKRVRASFVVDIIDYLWKGGRCSSVAALGANMLKIKPVIAVEDGKMDSVKKLRGTTEKTILEYVDYALKDKTNLDYSRIFITHSGRLDDEIIEKVKERIMELQPQFKEILITQAGCCISTHCGPKTLGVLFAEA